MKIGLHEPLFKGNEKKYLLDCIKTNWVSTSGKYLNLFEKKIKKITRSKYVVPVLKWDDRITYIFNNIRGKKW